MCGISLIISKNNENILNLLMASLVQLQNRGYDSAGFGFISNNKFNIFKRITTNPNDSIKLLENIITEYDLSTNIAVGHTRWATHGSKIKANAHPHISQNRNILLVHNGIIENYLELKNFLIDHGYSFYSETDSEIIVNLIEYFNKENNETDSILLTNKLLKGTWGLVILFNTSKTIYLLRNGSPLIFGYNENLIICTSELAGFNNLIKKYTKLESNILYQIKNNILSSIDNQNYNTSIKFQNITYEIPNELGDYKNWTIKEIFEQKDSIERATNYGARIYNNNIKLGGLDKYNFNIHNINHLLILGCGTSYHAALIGKIYFESLRIFSSIQVYDASEFTNNNIPIVGNTIVIFCSQSGETHDLYKNIAICKEANCITLGIINVVDSLIASEVDCGVYLNAGRENAVASTKSFTSMLIILALISQYFNKLKKEITNISYLDEIRKLPDQIFNILKKENLQSIEEIKSIILNNLSITQSNSMFILGKGKMYPIAKEGALKIKEISYIHAEAYPGGALKHGPLALLEEKINVILLIDNTNKNTMLNSYEEIKSRGAFCFIITEIPDLLNKDNKEHTKVLLIEKNNYQEILFIIVLQYLAYGLSIAKDINPDKPRNLAKVVSVQ